MPSLADLQRTVMNSHPSDWNSFETELGMYDDPDDPGSVQRVAVYEDDVELRIEQGSRAVKNFTEDWTEGFPDNRNNTSYSFWLVYGGSPVDHEVIVLVDGGRAWIPVPDRPDSAGDPWTITQYENAYAAALNGDQRAYQERLDIADIEVA